MGPRGAGARVWPHPLPLAHQVVPSCQVPPATLPGLLGRNPSPSSPSVATWRLCPRPGFLGLPWAAVGVSTRPPRWLPGAV